MTPIQLGPIDLTRCCYVSKASARCPRRVWDLYSFCWLHAQLGIRDGYLLPARPTKETA